MSRKKWKKEVKRLKKKYIHLSERELLDTSTRKLNVLYKIENYAIRKQELEEYIKEMKWESHLLVSNLFNVEPLHKGTICKLK